MAKWKTKNQIEEALDIIYYKHNIREEHANKKLATILSSEEAQIIFEVINDYRWYSKDNKNIPLKIIDDNLCPECKTSLVYLTYKFCPYCSRPLKR